MASLSEFRDFIDLFIAAGIPSGIAWYVRDKRKNKQVQQLALDQQNKHTLEFVQDAFSEERASLKEERASLKRQIESCGLEIEKLKNELKLRDEKIAGLESRLAELEHHGS